MTAMYKRYEPKEAIVTQGQMGCVTRFLDETCVMTNLFLYNTDELMQEFQPNSFVMDLADYFFIQSKLNEGSSVKDFVSLETFMNVCKGRVKKIYLRYLPWKWRGFVLEEILEAIPFLLQQQNTPLPESDTRIQKYREQYAPSGLVTEDTLQLILEDFKVNKELLVLVPDGTSLLTKEQSKTSAFCVPYFADRYGTLQWKPTDATLLLIIRVVCGINWSHNVCCGCHKRDCLMLFRQEIINVINTWMTSQKCITCQNAGNQILLLESHCAFKSYVGVYSTEHFNSNIVNVSGAVYKKTCAYYNLPMDSIIRSGGRYDMWIVRFSWIIGWIKQFYAADNPKDLVDFILEPLSEKFPGETWEIYSRYIKIADPEFFDVVDYNVIYESEESEEDEEDEEESELDEADGENDSDEAGREVESSRTDEASESVVEHVEEEHNNVCVEKVVGSSTNSSNKSKKKKKQKKKKQTGGANTKYECSGCVKNINRKNYLESEMGKMREEKQILIFKMQQANRHRKKEKQDREAAESEAKKYEDEAKEVISTRKKLENKQKVLKTKDEEIERLQQHISSLTDQSEKIENLEKKLEKQKITEKKQLESNKKLRSENEDFVSAAASFNACIITLDDELSKMKINFDESNRIAQSLEEENAELRRSLNRVRQNLYEEFNNKSRFHIERSDLLDQLKHTESKANHLEKVLEGAKVPVPSTSQPLAHPPESTPFPMNYHTPVCFCGVWEPIEQTFSECENCHQYFHYNCIRRYHEDIEIPSKCPFCRSIITRRN